RPGSRLVRSWLVSSLVLPAVDVEAAGEVESAFGARFHDPWGAFGEGFGVGSFRHEEYSGRVHVVLLNPAVHCSEVELILYDELEVGNLKNLGADGERNLLRYLIGRGDDFR